MAQMPQKDLGIRIIKNGINRVYWNLRRINYILKKGKRFCWLSGRNKSNCKKKIIMPEICESAPVCGGLF